MSENDNIDFSNVLNEIPDILVSSPSFPIEAVDKMDDIPFLPPSSHSSHNCFCENDDVESGFVTCSICGQSSHISCYHFYDKFPINERFICISCQQKATNQVLDVTADSVQRLENRISFLSDVFDRLQNEYIPNLPDTLENVGSCEELHLMLKNFLSFSKKVWKDVNKDLDEINMYTKVDFLGENN